MKKNRLILVTAATALAAVIIGGTIRAPHALVARLIPASSHVILWNDMHRGGLGRVEAIGAKLYTAYLQWAVSARLAEEAKLDTTTDDVRAIAQTMNVVRHQMLTGLQIPHPGRDWAALLAGYGYCDQYNGAVSQALAERFDKAELYGLRDAQGRSPHTVGRVWSKQQNDWLYFDAFCDPAVIYRKGKGGAPTFLWRSKDIGDLPPRGYLGDQIYALNGVPFNHYSSNFAGYLWSKLQRGTASQSLQAIQPPPRAYHRSAVELAEIGKVVPVAKPAPVAVVAAAKPLPAKSKPATVLVAAKPAAPGTPGSVTIDGKTAAPETAAALVPTATIALATKPVAPGTPGSFVVDGKSVLPVADNAPGTVPLVMETVAAGTPGSVVLDGKTVAPQSSEVTMAVKPAAPGTPGSMVIDGRTVVAAKPGTPGTVVVTLKPRRPAAVVAKAKAAPRKPAVKVAESAHRETKPAPPPPLNDAVFRDIVRQYTAARAEHLFNGLASAAPAYARVASDPRVFKDWRATELAIAARIFARAGEQLASAQ